jgi:hypothetical protein
MRDQIVGGGATPIPVPCPDASLTLHAVNRGVEPPAVHEPESPEYTLTDGEPGEADILVLGSAWPHLTEATKSTCPVRHRHVAARERHRARPRRRLRSRKLQQTRPAHPHPVEPRPRLTAVLDVDRERLAA